MVWNSRHLPLQRFLISFIFASFIVVAGSIQACAAEKKTLGFVVTDWNTAMYETLFMDECPEGPTPGNYEIWEASVTPEVRRSYPLMLFTKLRHINNRGRNGVNVCDDPVSFDDPPLKIVEGKYAYGIDLDGNADGTATAKTCEHKNFTSLNGAPGIDNQMYRLMGCVEAWKSYGHIENNANSHRLSSGLGMILIEVTDVDDTTNDDSVKVGFYRGIGSYNLDSSGKVLPYASYGIDHEDGLPRYGDIVSGKVVDGVLKTDSADVHLPFFGNYQYMNQLFRDMQLQMELPSDGKPVTGSVAGYYGVDQFYSYVRGMLSTFPNRHKFSCPSIYVAAHQLADGHPDPETGDCTTLSSAFKFDAVAAFINHPEQEERIADSGQKSP